MGGVFYLRENKGILLYYCNFYGGLSKCTYLEACFCLQIVCIASLSITSDFWIDRGYTVDNLCQSKVKMYLHQEWTGQYGTVNGKCPFAGESKNIPSHKDFKSFHYCRKLLEVRMLFLLKATFIQKANQEILRFCQACFLH